MSEEIQKAILNRLGERTEKFIGWLRYWPRTWAIIAGLVITGIFIAVALIYEYEIEPKTKKRDKETAFFLWSGHYFAVAVPIILIIFGLMVYLFVKNDYELYYPDHSMPSKWLWILMFGGSALIATTFYVFGLRHERKGLKGSWVGVVYGFVMLTVLTVVFFFYGEYLKPKVNVTKTGYADQFKKVVKNVEQSASHIRSVSQRIANQARELQYLANPSPKGEINVSGVVQASRKMRGLEDSLSQLSESTSSILSEPKKPSKSLTLNSDQLGQLSEMLSSRK